MLVRGIWEVRCSAKGCTCTRVVEGDWGEHPLSPAFWPWTGGGYIEVDDWLVSHRSRLMLCPHHAFAWKEYLKKAAIWDQTQREVKKSWWLSFRQRWSGNLPPAPEAPFEVR